MTLTCLLTALTALLTLTQLNAQSVPHSESARYWAGRGRQLVAGGEYAKAYSAFQLARSLGQPDMVRQMEDARRRNINQILLQSLLAEAQNLASNDQVQSLRLLEHARRQFPDSSRILQQVGDLVNQPNLWLYSLKSAQLWPSPGLRYVVAAGSPARLYACRGDSLISLFNFSAPIEDVFFAPDDRYVLVATKTGTILLDCQRQSARVLNRQQQILEYAKFSPDGRYVLASFWNDQTTRLYQILDGQLRRTNIVANRYKSAFSPDGRYVCTVSNDRGLATKQLYRLTADGPVRAYSLPADESARSFAFSADGRWLLLRGEAENSIVLTRLSPDTVQTQVFRDCYTDRLSEVVSADGRWLLLSFSGANRDSLWAVDNGTLTLRHVFLQPENRRVMSRFSPNGSCLLRSSASSRSEAQCWSLSNQTPTLLHQFTEKSELWFDLFSADGQYLLARHDKTDSLWRCSDTALEPVHGFQRPLRLTNTELPNTSIRSYYSPDGGLLLTYHAGAVPDSLWQIGPDKLTPLYGFRERLSASVTRFSADGQWVLGGEDGASEKTLYSTALLWPFHEPRLQAPLAEARFSEEGQYLLGRSRTQASNTQLRRSMASNSATVLYGSRAGRFRLLQKLPLPFVISECRFLNHDRYLLTYHESAAAEGANRYASNIWPLTDDGLVKPYLFRGPYVQATNSLGGARRTMSVQRRLIVAPDGQHLFMQSVKSNSADSLWQLTNEWERVRAFDRTLTTMERYEIDGITTLYEKPSAGFVGQYLWQTRASDSTAVIQPLRLAERTAYPLPVGVGQIMGFSPQTGHGVFTLKRDPSIPILHYLRQGKWQAIRNLPERTYARLNENWPEQPPTNLISPDGRLLFTKDPDHLWIYRLNGPSVSLLHSQGGVARWFAFVPATSGGGQTGGVLYSTLGTLTETFYLHLRAGGCRISRVGEGTLYQPPTVRNGLLYVARQLTDARVAIDVLEPATGTRLAQTVVRQLLTLTVRPDGTVWAVSRSGFHVLRVPTERLAWLRRANVAGLSPALQKKYVFN